MGMPRPGTCGKTGVSVGENGDVDDERKGSALRDGDAVWSAVAAVSRRQPRDQERLLGDSHNLPHTHPTSAARRERGHHSLPRQGGTQTQRGGGVSGRMHASKGRARTVVSRTADGASTMVTHAGPLRAELEPAGLRA
eukprot:1118555-Rhodomonas_salina.2